MQLSAWYVGNRGRGYTAIQFLSITRWVIKSRTAFPVFTKRNLKCKAHLWKSDLLLISSVLSFSQSVRLVSLMPKKIKLKIWITLLLKLMEKIFSFISVAETAIPFLFHFLIINSILEKENEKLDLQAKCWIDRVYPLKLI